MIADNYQEAISQMRDFGLDVMHVDKLGAWVKCKEVNGDKENRCQYKLDELRLDDGRVVLVGTYGVFRGAEFFHERIKLSGATKLSESERAAIRAKQKANEEEAARKRQQEIDRAAETARAEWDNLAPATEHPYLTRKRVKAFGLRIAENGDLAVPLRNGKGDIYGIQWIHPTKRGTGTDKPFWPKGLGTKGHYHLIGEPAWIVLICEGYATGASLAMATDLPVAVTFSAGNLLPVGEVIKARYPRAKILFCADDDYHNEANAGISKASQAALAVGGSWVAPHFSNDRPTDSKGDTDFNDLHVGYGLDVVTEQLFAHLAGLGWKAAPKVAPAAQGGEGGQSLAIHNAEKLAERFALIYAAKSTVFDFQERVVMALSDLRDACANKNYVREWQENPERIVVRPSQVGFDPTNSDPNIRCNLWGGWPATPKQGQCEMLLDLLYYLCSNEENSEEVYNWIIKWLAYPVQHPGAKMQTALLIHGPEGTGKNTFFSCIRQLYGRYGGIFSQTELESDYNGWASGKLFMIGNEVVTRAELYHQQGRLKNMITEPEWMVNEKFMPARNEANHCNFVFFSNRIDIAKLDKGDRRFCVVWTPEAMDKQVYDAVAAEIANGGAEALHHYLLHVDLGDFNEHTKPPMTRAKRDLIDLSMDNTERFFLHWQDGEIPLPFGPCLSAHLYEAYQYWCKLNGVTKPVQANTLAAGLNKRPGCIPSSKPEHIYRDAVKTKARVYAPSAAAMPDGETKVSWLTDGINAFASKLDGWRCA